MKYNQLLAWTLEMQQFSGSLEHCYLSTDRFVMALKGGTQLCYVLSNRDAFAYLDAEQQKPLEAKSIWQNLKNTQLSQLRIKENDRIILLNICHRDIYQQTTNYILVAELMTPQANLILCNDKMIIQDALKKYTYADNPQRQILPGLPYLEPKTSFSCSPSPDPTPAAGFPSFNAWFKHRYEHDIVVQQKADNIKIQSHRIEGELKKLRKKHKLQEQDLRQAELMDTWLACAEGLKSNLHNIVKGQQSFCTINYLDAEMKEIIIPLQADKSPKENLKFYVKKYQKAKKGLEIITANLAKTAKEIELTLELVKRVNDGEMLDLNLGKTEGVQQIIHKASQSDKLLNLKIGEDYQIVIGRKATENDFVTTELARPHDWWFHSRIYHGAHVILRCFRKQEPSPELIRHCCNLAAWYSQAKFSANVPVDYTQIRFVRKPRKSPAGYVIYSSHKTVYATPMDLRGVREALNL